jgi:hypothetical protein
MAGLKHEKKDSVENKNRRTLLALGATGVATFVLGKIVGPHIDNLLHPQDKLINRKDFENFTLVETNNEMMLSDKEGNDIVIIDKESFR